MSTPVDRLDILPYGPLRARARTCDTSYTRRSVLARFAPRGHPAGYRIYSKLAPGPWFNSVSINEYCRLYGQILAGLDPQRTYDELVALMAPAEPVLLCYEVPPFTAPQPIPQAGVTTIGRQNWCHRRLVAMWFQETLGIEVAELELPHGSLAATRHARGPAIQREPPSHVVYKRISLRAALGRGSDLPCLCVHCSPVVQSTQPSRWASWARPYSTAVA